MNIINGFLTIPGKIQLDLNLGSPGITPTADGYRVQLPDMRTEIILRRMGDGATGELVSKGMGARVVFDVDDLDGFLAALRA